MNYRHTYHAGNFADVHKHSVLALLLDYLKRKDSPFLYLDTHAGTGFYELDSVEAEKTGEWRGGVGQLIGRDDLPPEMALYWAAVQSLNGGGDLRRYPGSPALAAALLRPQDRLALCELHPQDVETLRRRFIPDQRVGVHHVDGYGALKSMLPPPERRGVVLIDPPFEVKDEVSRLCRGMVQAMKKWPTGIYGIWYPIKDYRSIQAFHGELTMLGLPKTLAADLLLNDGDDPKTLNGCGMVIVNPPWQLDQSLNSLQPWLAQVFAPGQGRAQVQWLVADRA